MLQILKKQNLNREMNKDLVVVGEYFMSEKLLIVDELDFIKILQLKNLLVSIVAGRY